LNFRIRERFGLILQAPQGKDDISRMVPSDFPRPTIVILATGALELLGAVGLLISQFRIVAACCLIALLFAMFPANIKAAQERLTVMGKPATMLWLRTPMQVLFIGLLWFGTGR
jgi:uncharacterized membrane protein